MRTTLKKISEATGFSTTTISLVLNNKGKSIPETTRAKITQVAKDLNYRPNLLAISLIKKQTKSIGLIISDIRNSFFSMLAKAIEDECHKNGLNLILCNSNDEHIREIEYINVLADKGIDGIIYGMSLDTNQIKAEETFSLMNELNIPFVMVDRYYKSQKYYAISSDHFLGGYLATKHLLALGHRKIACVTGPINLQDSTDRLGGYKKALEEQRIPINPNLFVHANYSAESGAAALDKLLHEDFSAIFAFNDLMAIGILHAAENLGLSIPTDFSLIGYDDIFFSSILATPLSTVRQPIEQIGSESVKLLLSLVNNEPPVSKTKFLKPKLIIRKSTNQLIELPKDKGTI